MLPIGAYARESVLLTIRFWTFALAQSAFAIIADDYNENGEWRIMENLALTACCCLVITLWSMAWERCMVTCCGGIDTKKYYSSRFFRPHYYWNSYDDINHRNDEEEDLIINLQNKQPNDIIKCSDPIAFAWLLRGQSIACGACLFVIAYSLHGMAWLPQVSMAAAATACCFCCDVTQTKCRQVSAFLVFLGVGLLAIDGFFSRPQEWTPHNLWLGVVMPGGSAVVLSKCSIIAARHGVRADRAVALSMPSVGIASLTFLSMYVPSPPKPIAPHNFANDTHGFYDGLASASAAWEYYYRLLRYNQLFSSGAPKAPSALNVSDETQYLYDMFMQDAWNTTNYSSWSIAEEARAWTARLVSNQTWMPYLAAPTAIFSFGTIQPRGAASTWACVAAPLLLWCTLTVFTAGFFRGRGKSTVAVWLIAGAVCQIWWRGVTLPLIAVIVLVKLALVFCILPDEMMARLASDPDIDDILDDIDDQSSQVQCATGQGHIADAAVQHDLEGGVSIVAVADHEERVE